MLIYKKPDSYYYMDNNFLAYLQQLEMMAFFSGYPLLYAVTLFIAGNQPMKNGFSSRISTLLPFAYALVGTLFLGLQLKNAYPDYSIVYFKETILQPYLLIWGLLSILFWIPGLARIKGLSLLHSLVFFFLLVKDIFLQSSLDKNLVRNDMKIYTDSLLLNLGTFAFIILLAFLIAKIKKKVRS